MKLSHNVLNILAAKTYKGIGNAWVVNNIKGNESSEEIVALLKKQSRHIDTSYAEFMKIQEKIEADLLKKANNLDGAVAIGDADFPFCRGNVKKSEQVTVLFYKGNVNLLSEKNHNIAVIGLLQPSNKIISQESQVVAELVRQNITTVSGLALGCDTIAHQETIKNGGQTVAVLPNTLAKIMPSSNSGLARTIIESGGLLVSEYHKEFLSQRELISRYIERDRLQALFSSGIILSASYAKNNLGNDSGSRHAMQYAKNYGLPRAVIYNEKIDLLDEQHSLSRQLIAEDNTVSILSNKNNSVHSFIISTKPSHTPQQMTLLG